MCSWWERSFQSWSNYSLFLSTNAPAATNAPIYMSSTDTPYEPKAPADKYIVVIKFHLNVLLLWSVFLDRVQNCVVGFLLDPRVTPLGTIENVNFTLLIAINYLLSQRICSSFYQKKPFGKSGFCFGHGGSRKDLFLVTNCIDSSLLGQLLIEFPISKQKYCPQDFFSKSLWCLVLREPW